jgi:hypothetical protein
MKKPIVLILVLVIVIGAVAVGYFIKHQNDVRAEKARIAEEARVAEEARIAKEKEFRDEYESLLNKTAVEINYQSEVSRLVCVRVFDFMGIMAPGEYARKMCVKMAGQSGIYEDLKKGKDEVDNLVKRLINPPSDLKTGYDLLLEMYGYYVQLYNQAVTPGLWGSSYQREYEDKLSEVKKTYNKALVVVPRLKDGMPDRAADLEQVKKKIKG